MTEPNRWKLAGVVFLLYATTLIESPAQTFRTLANLGGAYAESTLVQGTDGELYGTTYYGWVLNFTGNLFKITANGKLTTLYNFCVQVHCLDGLGPQAGLVLGTDGDFYGTTSFGGVCGYPGCGTIFQIDPRSSALTTLYRFCGSPERNCLDGTAPRAVLVLASNRDFYGTTEGGSVFEITPEGRFKTLYRFCGQANCPQAPFGGLVQATDGNFYGTTSLGGNGPYDGTVFRITPTGKLTIIYNFCSLPKCSDGQQPIAGLIQGTDGDLYGTTEYGGAHNGAGTVFKITLGGTLTTVYNFCSQANCNDGGQPSAGLVQATDGNFYGTTYWYGANGISGTAFKMTPAGALTTLHSFCSQINCADGASPLAGLVQATDGNFYGTTSGGVSGPSTVFSLNVGLSPFVTFVGNYGRVGQAVGILGQGLARTTSVALNGIPASFSVVSDTFIRATVPAGATTGYITVTTPSSTLTSNVPFHVIP